MNYLAALLKRDLGYAPTSYEVSKTRKRIDAASYRE